MKTPKTENVTASSEGTVDEAQTQLVQPGGDKEGHPALPPDRGPTSELADRPIDDRLIIEVPNFGFTMTDEEHESWTAAVFEGRDKIASLSSQKRKAVRLTFVMAYIGHYSRESSYFKAKLESQQLGIPASNNSFALSMACYFGLDTKAADTRERSNNSKALNRYITAAQQFDSMVEKLPHDANKIAVEASPDGVRKLLTLLEESGGINALAAAFGRGGDAPVRLPIDDAKLAAQILERGDEYLQRSAGNSNPKFCIGYVGDGEPRFGFELDIPAELKPDLYARFPIARPEIRALSELARLAGSVAEEPTDIPIDRSLDPAKAPKRTTSRMYMFHPSAGEIRGDFITVSPLLASSGTVVEARLTQELLGQPVQGHAVLRTEPRRSMEVLLTHAKLPLVLEFELGDIMGTDGVARIDIASDVTKNPEDGKVSVLVQRLKGEIPMTVDSASFAPSGNVVMGRHGWSRLVGEYPDKLQAIKKPGAALVEIIADGNTLRIVDPLASLSLDAAATGSGSIKVRLDDLYRFLRSVAQIQPVGDVTVLIDPKMIAFEFATASAAYRVCIPSAVKGALPNSDCTRSDRHLTKLEPIAWPQSEAAA